MNLYFLARSAIAIQSRKSFISFMSRIIFPFVALLPLAATSQAQTLKGPLRLVIAWPAGGPTDTVARIVAQRAGEILNMPIIVENKPGASGLIGSAFVAQAPPDGSTLLMAVFQDVTRSALGVKQQFDTLKAFDPIIKIYDLPFLITVNKSALPVSNLQQLLDYAKTKPLQYASPSVGSMGHLSFELISQLSGIHAQHIAYKGSSQAIIDVISGQIPMMYGDIVTALPQIRAGKLKAIAIGSASRVPSLPDVPTVAESGFPKFLGVAWGGIVAPTGIPGSIKAQLYAAFKTTMSEPKILAKIRKVGVEPAPIASPESFGRFMQDEQQKWSDLIKKRGITIN